MPTTVASTLLARASRIESQNDEVSPGMRSTAGTTAAVKPFQAKLTCGRPVVTLLKL